MLGVPLVSNKTTKLNPNISKLYNNRPMHALPKVTTTACASHRAEGTPPCPLVVVSRRWSCKGGTRGTRDATAQKTQR